MEGVEGAARRSGPARIDWYDGARASSRRLPRARLPRPGRSRPAPTPRPFPTPFHSTVHARPTAEPTTVHRAPRTLIASAALAVAWALGPGSDAAQAGSESGGPDEERTGVVEAGYAPGAAAAVLAPLAPDPEARVRAVGGPVPPGLTAARTKERRDRRRADLEALAARYDGQGDVALVQVLDGMLLDPSIDDTGWIAAATVAGDLCLTRLGLRIAGGLAPAAGPRRIAAARRALDAMYGVWFDTADELLPLTSLAEGPALTAYRERMFALEDQLVRRSALLWETRGDLALEALDDPSPRVREQAARALGSALSRGAIEVERAADALLARAGSEHDPAAFTAQLEALVPALQVRSVDDPRRIALRDALVARVEDAAPAAQHAIARCVAALPWVAPATDEEGPDAPEAVRPDEGLAILGRALERVLGHEPIDADVTIAVLQGLRSFAHTHDLARLPGTASVTDAILALLDRGRAADEVRLAAAAALADLARPEDLERLIALVRGSDDVALRYAYAGAIASVAGAVELGSPDGRALYALVSELVDGDEPQQMRERALRVFDELTSGVSREELEALGLGIGVLLERWGSETSTAARATIDGLVRRLGSRADLEALIRDGGFASAANFSARVAADVATTLAADHPRLAVRSARAMVDGTQGADGAARRASLTAALELALVAERVVAQPAGPSIEGDDASGGVDQEQRASSAQYVEWALELRRLAGTLSTPLGAAVGNGSAARPTLPTDVLADLLDVHVPRAELAPERRALATALLVFDADRPGADRDDAAVEDAFGEAIELNAGAARRLLLRERARFHLARGARDRALLDLADLFDGARGPERAQVLDLATLRAYATTLTDALDAEPALAEIEEGPRRDEARARLAALTERRARVLAELVAHADWAAEVPLVRANDLIALMESAARTSVPDLLVRARAAYDASGLGDRESTLCTALDALDEGPAVLRRVEEAFTLLDTKTTVAVPVEAPPAEGADADTGTDADPAGGGSARGGRNAPTGG